MASKFNCMMYRKIKRYWMTIKTESLREMLEIVNRVTPITYTINGEEVSITGRK